jgi:hypothetical protein
MVGGNLEKGLGRPDRAVYIPLKIGGKRQGRARGSAQQGVEVLFPGMM